ncbi:hypothetical protein FH972_023315 [Carpinus fangiana]|uniref:Ankyrin repeat protein n=1 Tax=Carpinus fangiana TaxID=176857 RepID=A0A5N6KV72_9ROSI|nr:hypothetical protein FH972_023315 [Carpinus fangiana]
MDLPQLPAKHRDVIPYLNDALPSTPVLQSLAPYIAYENRLREIFAQQPDHPAVQDPLVNLVPLYDGHEKSINIQARHLADETLAQQEKYLLPLKPEDRKAGASPAVVQSLKDFQNNFNLFSEMSLVDMDWSNVVAAGSAVVTPLMPVPEKFASSKRAQRAWYHEHVAPASDVDLFLYGLSEDEAVEKIKQIERCVRDSVLQETTTVRTKNAITIVSHYPVRHVQIVLRIYKSVSEILTGFDVDCSCAAYDGTQVYATPRALGAYMTQINTIDLSRRSPSYENRLSKYSRRGFEIHWPALDRSRIDPTIFERSFPRTVGLARLLVLEKLPTNKARDAYMDERRKERGRPALNHWVRNAHKLPGNIKEDAVDELPEWKIEEDAGSLSNYHTLTIPYGKYWHAKRIEKLLYTQDLLLNAEWNKPKDRLVHLHRHPAFFGMVEDVIEDCCGFCPAPTNGDEQDTAKEEDKVFVSGPVSFIKDDPGRQSIGSFNPSTADDWCEMAYVGNTARLCQAIVDGDLDYIRSWCSQDGINVNRRDYTGRTPLQLAVMCSTLEVVQYLIDHGARIVARMVDGKTSLHLAAIRGHVRIIRAILQKSEENEHEEEQKADERKQLTFNSKGGNENAILDEDGSQVDLLESDTETEDEDTATDGSYVNVRKATTQQKTDNVPDDSDANEEPDVFDVNVLSWDQKSSPLHYAIAKGHLDAVTELVERFGADVLLPIKFLHEFNNSPRAALLTLVIASRLPLDKANAMSALLLSLGASPSQADMDHVTALHRLVAGKAGTVETVIKQSRPASTKALSHIAFGPHYHYPNGQTPLVTAISESDVPTALILLSNGAKADVDFDAFIKAYISRFGEKSELRNSTEDNKKMFHVNFEQPVIEAAKRELPDLVRALIEAGASPNTLPILTWKLLSGTYGSSQHGESLLDIIRVKIDEFTAFLDKKDENIKSPLELKSDSHYVDGYAEDSYRGWTARNLLEDAKKAYKAELEKFEHETKKLSEEGTAEKRKAIETMLEDLKSLEQFLIAQGAKTFIELHPKGPKPQSSGLDNQYRASEPKEFTVKFTFNAGDLNDEKQAAYEALFEAAWQGDLDKIKMYTLGFWGFQKKNPPLRIAVQDSLCLTPFSIAVFMGHFQVAQAILEIVSAQYQPENAPKKRRFMLATRHEDSSEEDFEDEGRDDDQVRLTSELVDDGFTIDDIGALADQVKSRVKPMDLLSWSVPLGRFLEDYDGGNPHVLAGQNLSSSPAGQRFTSGKLARKRLMHRINMSSQTHHYNHYGVAENEVGTVSGTLVQYALYVQDRTSFDFLLDLILKSRSEHLDGDDIKFSVPSLTDLRLAMKLGRTDMLATLISRCGTGLPLDDLVKRSGVETLDLEEPTFYQGLSIHGQKRRDWAEAAKGTDRYSLGRSSSFHPPLLEAARQGNLEAVEWFMSDSAFRCYTEFAAASKSDTRVQSLAKSEGGIERQVSKWLDQRRSLAIHCAVLATQEQFSEALLSYLLRVIPETIDIKSPHRGHFSLQAAFSLRRPNAARLLIEAGADQTCRDNQGANIIHSLLVPMNKNRQQKEPIEPLLELVDSRILESLFTERSRDGPGSLSPLASWLEQEAVHYHEYCTRGNEILESKLTVLRTSLRYSKGCDLSILNGAGDTPLHVAIRTHMTAFARVILRFDPSLLWRENATGRTPYEIAEDHHLANQIADPPSMSNGQRYHYSFGYNRNTSTILQKPTKEFLPQAEDEDDDVVSGSNPNDHFNHYYNSWRAPDPRRVKKTWKLCEEVASSEAGRQSQRHLVALLDANEVAKRLADRQAFESKERSRRSMPEQDSNQEIVVDEVETWYDSAVAKS